MTSYSSVILRLRRQAPGQWQREACVLAEGGERMLWSGGELSQNGDFLSYWTTIDKVIVVNYLSSLILISMSRMVLVVLRSIMYNCERMNLWDRYICKEKETYAIYEH